MGRAKLNMELIRKEKSRNLTFKKRKEGLLRKMHEFTTLCDVDACVIIYGPKQEYGNFVEPEIFPRDPDEVKRIINIYKASKSKDSSESGSNNKNFTLTDFYLMKKGKIDEELANLRRKKLDMKYPIQLDNLVTREGCLQFHAALTKKAEHVRELISHMKMKNMSEEGGFDIMNNNGVMEFAPARLGLNLYGPPSFIQQMGVMNHLPAIQYPPVEHRHNQEIHSSWMNNRSSMMGLLLTGNEHYYESGPSNGLHQQVVFFDPPTELDLRVMSHDERMTRYYAAAQSMPYMQIQQPQQTKFVSNHLPNTSGVNEEDLVHYQMKNNVARFRHDQK